MRDIIRIFHFAPLSFNSIVLITDFQDEIGSSSQAANTPKVSLVKTACQKCGMVCHFLLLLECLAEKAKHRLKTEFLFLNLLSYEKSSKTIGGKKVIIIYVSTLFALALSFPFSHTRSSSFCYFMV